MNLEILYLKLEQNVPFQIINTESELIIFENRHAPFSIYSKYYVVAVRELIKDEKKHVIIDYLQNHKKDTMQVLVLKSISPCLGNFTKIKDLSLDRMNLLNQYYTQEFLPNPILNSYYEFMAKTFFNKKESLENLIKNKTI